MQKQCTCHQSLQHWRQLGVRLAPSGGWCQLGRPYPIQQWNGLWSRSPSCHYWNASAELLHNDESTCLAFHLYLHPTPWNKRHYEGYLRFWRYWCYNVLPIFDHCAASPTPFILVLYPTLLHFWSWMDHREVVDRGLEWESGKSKKIGCCQCEMLKDTLLQMWVCVGSRNEIAATITY